MMMMASSPLVMVALALVLGMVARVSAQDMCPACKGVVDPCVSACRFNPYATKCIVDCTSGCKALWKDPENKIVNCEKLTPRCILMHQESDALKRQSRSGPASGGRLDTDGLYDPKCFDNGTFRAEQSNETTRQRWCVNSAGVRNTDKLVDADPECKRLVMCTQIVLDFFVNMTHPTVLEPQFKTRLQKVMQDSFLLSPSQMSETMMDDTGNVLITIKAGNTSADQDVGTVAYYLEKQFLKGELPGLPREALDLSKRGAQVWYYDDEPPRMNMKHMAPGIIAIICVLVLSLVAAIVVIVVMKKRSSKKKDNIFEGQELQQKLT
ncbi:epithelial cell adhesion molecule-like [Lampetra fluviatilis]